MVLLWVFWGQSCCSYGVVSLKSNFQYFFLLFSLDCHLPQLSYLSFCRSSSSVKLWATFSGCGSCTYPFTNKKGQWCSKSRLHEGCLFPVVAPKVENQGPSGPTNSVKMRIFFPLLWVPCNKKFSDQIATITERSMGLVRCTQQCSFFGTKNL